MARHIGFTAFLAGLAVMPGVAWGAGQITGVAANPASTAVNQPVTVTVQGSGTCSQVVVRCQAPAAPEHVKLNVAMPFSVPCSYATTGTKTVTASAELPNADCPGDKITQVTVQTKTTRTPGPGGSPVALPPVFPALLPPPQIEAILPFSKPSPGGAVMVLGKNFGSQPGKLQIIGQFGSRELVDLQWSSNGKFIGGKVPEICGVHDHPGTLMVTTQAGANSNQFPVTYLAKKEWKWLSYKDVQVTHCSNDGNENVCNNKDGGGDSYYFSSATVNPSDTAIHGYHYNCWGCIGDDGGSDTYQITLLNGWKLSDILLCEHDPGSEGDVNGPSPEFPLGATSWAPKWSWDVTPNDHVSYAAAIEIEGDCGVPYK